MIYRLGERIGEPLFEILLVGEDVRHQEMHEWPELHHIILQGCTSQEKSPFSVEAEKRLPSLTFEILDVLRLIKHHIVPLLSSESKMILDHKLVRSNANVKWVLFAPAVSLDSSFLLVPEIGKYLEARTPPFELHLPVHDDGGWNNDEMWSPSAFITGQRGKHCNGLDGFSQTHFVCQYSIELPIVQCDHPVQSNNLIFTQRSFQ